MAKKMTSSSGYFNKTMLGILEKGEKKAKAKPKPKVSVKKQPKKK